MYNYFCSSRFRVIIESFYYYIFCTYYLLYMFFLFHQLQFFIPRRLVLFISLSFIDLYTNSRWNELRENCPNYFLILFCSFSKILENNKTKRWLLEFFLFIEINKIIERNRKSDHSVVLIIYKIGINHLTAHLATSYIIMRCEMKILFGRDWCLPRGLYIACIAYPVKASDC